MQNPCDVPVDGLMDLPGAPPRVVTPLFLNLVAGVSIPEHTEFILFQLDTRGPGVLDSQDRSAPLCESANLVR